MELNELDTRETTFAMDVLHPKTGAPTGATIVLRGQDSDAYQARSLELQRRRLAQLAKKGRINGAEPEQVRMDAIDLLAACTAGWSGITRNGEPLAFSEAAAQGLYRDHPFIREQVDEAIHQRANFLPGSSPS